MPFGNRLDVQMFRTNLQQYAQSYSLVTWIFFYQRIAFLPVHTDDVKKALPQSAKRVIGFLTLVAEISETFIFVKSC